jgi:hypothetical protein
MKPRRTAADVRGDAFGYLDATRAICARRTFAYAVRRAVLWRAPRGDARRPCPCDGRTENRTAALAGYVELWPIAGTYRPYLSPYPRGFL